MRQGSKFNWANEIKHPEIKPLEIKSLEIKHIEPSSFDRAEASAIQRNPAHC